MQVLLFQPLFNAGADPPDVGQRELCEQVWAQVLCAGLEYLQQLGERKWQVSPGVRQWAGVCLPIHALDSSNAQI